MSVNAMHDKYEERKYMPIEKKKNTITVKTFFDGDLDATDIFVSLIANQVSCGNLQKEVEHHENVIYNKGGTTHGVLSPGQMKGERHE